MRPRRTFAGGRLGRGLGFSISGPSSEALSKAPIVRYPRPVVRNACVDSSVRSPVQHLVMLDHRSKDRSRSSIAKYSRIEFEYDQTSPCSPKNETLEHIAPIAVNPSTMPTSSVSALYATPTSLLLHAGERCVCVAHGKKEKMGLTLGYRLYAAGDVILPLVRYVCVVQ